MSGDPKQATLWTALAGTHAGRTAPTRTLHDEEYPVSRPLRREEVAELAATLDAIRHRIDAGELSATPAFRHRLDGASVALAVVLGRRSTLVDELVLDS